MSGTLYSNCEIWFRQNKSFNCCYSFNVSGTAGASVTIYEGEQVLCNDDTCSDCDTTNDDTPLYVRVYDPSSTRQVTVSGYCD